MKTTDSGVNKLAPTGIVERKLCINEDSLGFKLERYTKPLTEASVTWETSTVLSAC